MKNLILVCTLLASTTSYALTFGVTEIGKATIKDVNVNGVSNTTISLDLSGTGVNGTRNEDVVQVTAIGNKLPIGSVADAQKINLDGEDLKKQSTVTAIMTEVLNNRVLAVQEGIELINSNIIYTSFGCNTTVSTKKKFFSKEIKTTTTECSASFGRKSNYEIKN